MATGKGLEQFEQPGKYEFVIELDGTPVDHLGFRIIQVPQMGPVIR